MDEVSRLRPVLGASFSSPPIASSTHSAVFATFSRVYNRKVAVKVINKKGMPRSIAEKFLPREIEITSKIRHPHIVSFLLIHADPLTSSIILISEYYPRGTLLQLVNREERVEENPRGIHMIRQLSEALRYLHDRQIVHRDVKLENILLDQNGDIRLADFGFARSIQRRERSNSFCGTRPYSSPQLVMYEAYDPYAADWFAVGVVLYTLITGRWPPEPVYARTLTFNCYQPTAACQSLIRSLLHEDESERGGYDEIVNCEWAAQRPSWMFASATHVYEEIPYSTEESLSLCGSS